MTPVVGMLDRPANQFMAQPIAVPTRDVPHCYVSGLARRGTLHPQDPRQPMGALTLWR